MAASRSKKKGTGGGGGGGGGGIIKLKIVAKKLQRSLNVLGKKAEDSVPEDVKEGHFVVLAVEGVEEPRRFVVPLSFLAHPTFLRLLEQAAEEYGFNDRGYGALTVPCRPEELERILAERWEEETTSSSRRRNDDGGGGGGRDRWGSSSCKTMVQSF